MKNITLFKIILCLVTLAASVTPQQKSVFKPDLSHPEGIHEWIFDGSGSWNISDGKLVLSKAGVPSGPIRRPAALAILGTKPFLNATIEAEIRSTAPLDTIRRDLDLVIAYESSTRFYYIHLAGTADDVHNGIFLVNNANRRRIDDGKGIPQMKDSVWHHVRVDRDGRSGTISVYVDNMNEPALKAVDTTIRSGRVGFGSFDDTGEFRNVVVSGEGGPKVSGPAALLFIVDGLQSDAAKVAIAHGASNMKFLFENGVWVEETYCSCPAAIAYLPDGSRPWGTAAPPNIAMHTGTHVFESKQMDDIFLAARRAGMKSVFSGSAENYTVFNTADYSFARSNADSAVIEFAIDHLKKDGVRLLSVHVQETRRNWMGPEEKTKPGSSYQNYLLTVDYYLGKLLRALKEEGVWDSTYVIVSSDHGMGMTKQSNHPASVLSSWQPYMNFYGPGIKKGATIPYAESPDLAIMIDFFLRLTPLQGHTDPSVSIEPRGTTGTLLTNIFENNPAKLDHPKLIRRYLESRNWKPSDDYAEYRSAMLSLMKELASKK